MVRVGRMVLGKGRPAKMLAIAALLTICQLTDSGPAPIKQTRRRSNSDTIEVGWRKAQTIPEGVLVNEIGNNAAATSNVGKSTPTEGASKEEAAGKTQGKKPPPGGKEETGNTGGGNTNSKQEGTEEAGGSNVQGQEKQPTSEAGTGAFANILQEIVLFHNLRRKVHAAPALTSDEQLSRDAEEWAEDLARRRTLEHSNQALPGDDKAQGENLAEMCHFKELDGTDGGKKLTDMWYNEVKKYDWNHPGFNQATGHFTQLVWKSTKHVGFGWSSYRTDDDFFCYIGVARYYPEGNLEGQFEENVLKGSYKP